MRFLTRSEIFPKLAARARKLAYAVESKQVVRAKLPKVQRRNDRKGELNENSKLTDEKVAEAYRMMLAGWYDKAIAKHFGVAASTINGITNGRNWKHVPRPHGPVRKLPRKERQRLAQTVKSA